MKKIGLVCVALLACGSLAGCAKKINGVKAYSTVVSTKVTPANGSKDYRQGLMKIKGTSSAPNGYQVVAINSNGKNSLVSGNNSMAGNAVVENGKFTGYVDPLKANKDAKKGTKLKYHFIAVKDPNNLGQKDKAAFKKQVNKKFKPTTIKLSFDPTTSYVQTNVQNALGKGAIVTKKSKTVYAIMPKKDSNFEDKVSQSMYGDKNQWADITKQISRLSAKIKTPAGRVALVLMNPENHKKFLFVSIGGKTKFDAITSGTVNSDATKASNIKSTNKAANSGSSSGDEDSDGDDFELGVILGWLMAYDDEYGDDSDVDTNADTNNSDNDNYTDTNNSDNDNYTDNDSDDYSYDNSDDYDDSSSDDQSQSSSTGPAAQPDTDDDDSFAY
ncbi:hypothetical protein [Limosilactobacillus reuteri]|uniref:hypothetical protein n=1 Tax=Limosilactobacillus reuteri TaxID=1598 RepID=UPI0020732B73|nr:hypothetical protein [Limosilactobacillus reuteri]